MITKFIFAAALPALVLSVSSLRAADAWETDLEKAKATATKEKRDLLMDFTGSDWCHWCIQLHEEVFDKDAFKQDAPKSFVLVQVDFPEQKEQSDDTKMQNEKLQEDYHIEGFPTIVLADAEGRPYAMTGYEKGGAAKYMEHLTELRKKHAARDAAFKKAADAKGAEKAQLIVDALKELSPALVHTFYKKEIEEAIAADKDDVSGVKKSRDEFASEREFKTKVTAMEKELAGLHDKKQFKEFTARIDKFIADEKVTGRRRQEVLMAKLGACEDDFPAALKVLDEVIAVDPKSDMAEQAVGLKDSIKESQKQEAEDKKSGKPKVEEPAEEEKPAKEEK